MAFSAALIADTVRPHGIRVESEGGVGDLDLGVGFVGHSEETN